MPLPKTINAAGTSSMFSQQELARLVQDTVPAERDGVPVRNAIVATVDKDGAALVVKMQKGEHWTVEMAVRRDWSGDVSSGAKVMYSW